MRKVIYALSLWVWAICPVTLFSQTPSSAGFQPSQTSSVFFAQQKGTSLGFHVVGNNAHIVADVYALSGKHIARVLDKIISQGDYSFSPFARCNLPQQTYIVRLSNGVQSEFVRMINLGNESGSNLRSVRTGSARLGKVAGSNEKVVKTYQSKEIGNGAYCNQIFNDADSNGVYRGFKIGVQNDDNYYISSWIQGLAGSSQDMFIDGQTMASGRTILQSNGWQASTMMGNSAPLSPVSVHLSSGDHIITFQDKGPGVPEVEFIRLGKTVNDVFISDSAYQNKLAAINAYAASHPIQPVNDDSAEMAITNSPATYTPPPRNDSLNDYTGFLGQPFSYTYRSWFYFNTGDHPTFSVQNATTSYLIFLFNADNTTPSTSWEGVSINVTIPNAGNYMVMVRAYYTGNRGTGNLYFNNSLYASGIIIAGTYYAASLTTKTGILNYFTCNPPNNPYTTDTYIFLATFRSNPVAAYNDDYIGPGNFAWGYWSRCKFNFSGWSNPYNRAYIFGSAYSSTGDGNCDFYLCNEAATYDTSYYFELKKDDAMESAEEDTGYNCFSWSGGRTDLGGNFSPEDPTFPWADTTNMGKKSYDNYYGNTPVSRFIGAMTYLPTNDTLGSEIDLWEGMWQGSWVHASVRKPGDNFCHGYDWESKLHQDERIFHPRYALEGWLGTPAAFYKHSGAMAKSSAINGNKLADPISLSASDMKKIDSLSGMVDATTRVTFDSLYTLWKKTWSSPNLKIQSNPKMFFYSKEYSLFAALCVSKGKVIIPLCMKKYLEGDFLAGYAIYKFGLIANNEKIMETVRLNSEQGKISAGGYFIIDRQGNGWIRYFKILLDQEL